MLYQLAYTQAHDQLLDILLEMKDYLDWYREQDYFNAHTYEKRKAWVLGIGAYVKASKATFQNLQEEAEQSFTKGLERGRELERKNNEQAWRGHIHCWELLEQTAVHPDVLRTIIKKEEVRRITLELAKAKFPDLY